jgi:hypothetical protein
MTREKAIFQYQREVLSREVWSENDPGKYEGVLPALSALKPTGVRLAIASSLSVAAVSRILDTFFRATCND